MQGPATGHSKCLSPAGEGPTFTETIVSLGDFHCFQPEREKQDEAAGAVCVCVHALSACL